MPGLSQSSGSQSSTSIGMARCGKSDLTRIFRAVSDEIKLLCKPDFVTDLPVYKGNKTPAKKA
jgi:hypothetical protein